VKDALLLVDLIGDFEHEDGDALLASFRERHEAIAAVIDDARRREIPVIYANDNAGIWDGNAQRLVREALAGPGGDLLRPLVPQEGDRFVVKPRYSAFDHTPLVLILRELEIERILMAGAATEMCIVQTAIDARERGFKVTVLTDACATTNERLERLSFEYLEEVVGARLQRVS
jgi:nicotinamidase-related amidase